MFFLILQQTLFITLALVEAEAVSYWLMTSVSLLDHFDRTSHTNYWICGNNLVLTYKNNVTGVRMPHLQMSGNHSFHVMADYGLEYDSSWPTIEHRNPGLWPYTLDFASTQDCMTPPCPTASIPKPWVLPIISWTDLQGFPCALANTCFYTWVLV